MLPSQARANGSVVSRVVFAALAFGLSLGCGDGNGPGSAGGGGSKDSGSSGGSGGGGACKEPAPLFAPLVLGDAWGEGGSDMIRTIRIDEATGEMFFNGYSQMFYMAPGSSTPTVLMQVASGMTHFWLMTNELLFPGTTDTVLYTTLRTGGALTPLVAAAPSTTDRPSRVSLWEAVDLKNVYWVDNRGLRLVETPPPDLNTIYKSAWRSPEATPTQLYQGNLDLERLVIAGSYVYFREETAKDSNKYRPMRVGVFGDAATDLTATLNGDVLAGNNQELVVSRMDLQNNSWGLFVMQPDGTNQVKVDDSMLINEIAEREGTWAFVDFPGGDEVFRLFTYSAATGRRDIGCVVDDDTTIHAAALTADAMYVAIYRHDKTTILRYPL
jgi:hypothetical protein